MEKILISACLVGDNCRYDGKNNKSELIDKLLEKYELIPFCPEVEGGLPTPRIPSEIIDGEVVNQKGKKVTAYFTKGAELAFNICMYLGIKTVILKENSPSCGSHKIYDGTFKNRLKDGMGITSSYLKAKGIKVISENEINTIL